MKKYPKINWKQLSKEEKIFDLLETAILRNMAVLEWTEAEWDTQTIAYNSAYSILIDIEKYLNNKK